MKPTIHRAAQKLRRSAILLEHRRLNWRVETNHRIRWEFELFIRSSREVGLPLEFSLRQYDTPNEGVVQLNPARTLTGVVDRQYSLSLDGETYSDTPVLESGGELVASLSATGFVYFTAHPRSSDRTKPKRAQLFLLGPLDPATVTPAVVRRALARYLLILQASSLIGNENALTRLERWQVLWLHFRDLRTRYDFYRSMLTLENQWGRLFVAASLAFAGGYITATLFASKA